MPVGVEVGKDALFGAADRVIELMYEQGYIAECRSRAFALAGYEHNFALAKNFIVEKRTAYSGMSRLAVNKVVDVCIIVVNRRASRKTL